MTELESEIVEFLRNKRSDSITAYHMSFHVGKKKHYGPNGKQIIGMAVGRMRKKGIEANYVAMK